MRIEITNLTEENLQDAPEWESHPFSCKYCVYWECPEVLGEPIKETKVDLIRRKTGWLQKTNALFGNCGKILYVDGVAAGYAQYAPPEFLPNSANYPAGPPSSEAVLIACLFIPQNRFRGLGLGSQLLKSIIDELRQRGVKSIETFARKGSTDNPSGPIEFYLSNGFKIDRDDSEYPLMSLDLREA
jgi:GNAT superfamily N-acetyltransferase